MKSGSGRVGEGENGGGFALVSGKGRTIRVERRERVIAWMRSVAARRAIICCPCLSINTMPFFI